MTDSHLALPVVDVSADVLRARELVPFAAVAHADVACVMTAAVVVPALDPDNPATFSSTLLKAVLREELGFRGVIVTDALDMAGASADTGIPEAAVRALVAGCDLLCLGSETGEKLFADTVAAIVAAVSDGRLSSQRLNEAADAVGRLAARPRPAAPTALAERPDLPVAQAFEVSERAREWLRADGPVSIVQVESASNLAVGRVPGGPASLFATVDDGEAARSSRVAVVGRDLGAQHPAWSVADAHRAAGRDTIVVECGWPRSHDGGAAGPAADVLAWGGSSVVARALVDLLLGRGTAS